MVHESDTLRGDGPYAVSKIVAEQFCRDQTKEHDFPVAICRLGTLYGPMEAVNPHRPRVSIPCKLANAALCGTSIRVFGLSRRRPYCYVGDAARTVIDLALLPVLPSDTFNVGSPDRVALSDLLDIVSRLRPDFTFKEVENYHDADVAMMADDERPVLDTSHLESLLDTVQWLKMEEGITHFMNWVRKS
jgi:dTDP-glucose 4,6-dehydratase